MDLTTEEARELAISCAIHCGYWRWGDGVIEGYNNGFLVSTAPRLPGIVCCEHADMFREGVENASEEVRVAFGIQYSQAVMILRREAASFAHFN